MVKNNPRNKVILTKEHAGKWVAFSLDKTKVVSYADTLEQLSKNVDETKVIFSKVADPSRTYAF